jgi:hypothetical protein
MLKVVYLAEMFGHCFGSLVLLDLNQVGLVVRKSNRQDKEVLIIKFIGVISISGR